MVGLPRLVGVFRPAPKDELVLVPVRDRSLKCQRDKGRIECLDDLADGRVTRHRQFVSFRLRGGEPVQGGDAWAWPGQRQSFDERDSLR